MATPFELDRGTRQGRIPGGYELGHADLIEVNLAPGDEHEVSQTFTITAGNKVVQAIVQVRVPDSLPTGASWVLEMLLNGVAHYTRTLDVAGQRLELHPVVRLRGAPASPTTNQVAIRLRLA